MKINEEVFRENVKRWGVLYPKSMEQLKAFSCPNLQFHYNADGTLNLINTLPNNNTVYYHSLQDPLKEASDLFQSLNLVNKSVLIVFGVGLAYIYEKAKSWLHENPINQLVFLEPDLEVLKLLFQTERGTELLNDPQVWVTPVEPEGFFEIYPPVFSKSSYLFIPLPLYQKLITPFVETCRMNFDFKLKLKVDNLLEFVDHGQRFFSNYYRNLLELPQAYLGNSLMGKFKNIPAIICGAGPSLAKSLPYLENLKDKALIFAGGTAMNGLNSAGLNPHFGVGIDPNLAQMTRLIMNQAFEVPYFYRNRMSNEAVKFIHGPRLFLTGSVGYEIAPYFEEKLGIKGITIAEGYNVINYSLSIAQALGCNPIILTGVDLAYTDGLSYCPGILNHPLHEKREFFGTKTAHDDLVQKNDIYGKPVMTLWKWVAESLWFTQYAFQNPELKLFNATLGGIGFDGIPTITFESLSSKHLVKSYDMEGLLRSEIVQACFPCPTTPSVVNDALHELLESLKKCEKLLQSLLKIISENLYREEVEVLSQISEHETQIRHSLEDEVAYKYLLKSFGENYEAINIHEHKRWMMDKDSLPAKEIAKKKIKMEKGRVVFQLEAVKIHTSLIEEVFAENAEKGIKERLALFQPEINQPCSHSGEIYTFSEDKYTLYDPAIPLDHQETFENHTRSVPTRTFHENGSLAHEEYRCNGKLHGPSRFYSKKGQLLVENWFIDDKREGRGLFYFSDGTLGGINHYRNNKLEGKQIYYYPSGSVKSVLNYTKNLLHGEIKLYHPSGAIFRQLQFVEGKRDGFDKIWNAQGTLLIEAEFDKNTPVGKTKQWHPSGVLAKEVVFTADSPLYEVQNWDEQGEPILPLTKPDFFEQVAAETKSLTETLHKAVSQVGKVTPTMKENLEPTEVQLLNKQLAQLDDISNKMMFISGLDPSNPDEAIWKTPELQQELEEEMKQINEKISGQISLLKNSLKDTLKLIDQQFKSND